MRTTDIDTDSATIEPILRQLLEQHGQSAVEIHLARLMPTIGWLDFQRVQSAVTRLSNPRTKKGKL